MSNKQIKKKISSDDYLTILNTMDEDENNSSRVLKESKENRIEEKAKKKVVKTVKEKEETEVRKKDKKEEKTEVMKKGKKEEKTEVIKNGKNIAKSNKIGEIKKIIEKRKEEEERLKKEMEKREEEEREEEKQREKEEKREKEKRRKEKQIEKRENQEEEKRIKKQQEEEKRMKIIQELKARENIKEKERKIEIAKSEKDEEKDEEKDINIKELKSPICCVLGHVDTGKTKLLDKIRKTNVQGGEAGGITQQIGATYIPIETIIKQTEKMKEEMEMKIKYNVPGLLMIDTPGHESFSNMRARGSSICDIAILVVDIMHGLEQQTIESLKLLREKKIPFIVALNKIDLVYEWKSTNFSHINASLKNQKKNSLQEFENRTNNIVMQLAENGFNAVLYYKNKQFTNYVSLVPVSAHTGEGIPDLMTLIVQLSQKYMSKKITYSNDTVCTILEVKVTEGYGTTIDVILVNGMLNEGDTIVFCGINGPIVTNIKCLLTPQPLKELRIKSEYIHHKHITAAQGIKIVAPDLHSAVPGSSLLICKSHHELESIKQQVMLDFSNILNKISKNDKGITLQSSSLGSLESLLSFVEQHKIPVSSVNIGPIHKKDVIRSSIMLDTCPQHAVILAFDVSVTKDAEEEAAKLGVKIFTASTIYHLVDSFLKYIQDLHSKKIQQFSHQVIWPCILRIIPHNIFHKRDPITFGVDVIDGTLTLDTPLFIPSKNKLVLGKVKTIQFNGTKLTSASKGSSVAISIDSDKSLTYGRHFDHNDLLYSHLSRSSIDLLKDLYPQQLNENKDLRLLITKIKKLL